MWYGVSLYTLSLRTGFNSLDFVFSLLSYFNAAKSQHHKVLQGSHDNLKTNRDRTWFDSAKQKRQIIVSSLHSIVISALILSVDFVGMPLFLFYIVSVLLWGFDNCYCFSDIHHIVFTPFFNDNLEFFLLSMKIDFCVCRYNLVCQNCFQIPKTAFIIFSF